MRSSTAALTCLASPSYPSQARPLFGRIATRPEHFPARALPGQSVRNHVASTGNPREARYRLACMSTPLSDDGLFDLPESARRPNARVILVMGASGSGKTRFTSRTGLPVVSLDDFYYDGDRPGMPLRHGMVDWDSPRTWDKEGAIQALRELCTAGTTTLPDRKSVV